MDCGDRKLRRMRKRRIRYVELGIVYIDEIGRMLVKGEASFQFMLVMRRADRKNWAGQLESI